jgi:hypothetical protein
MLKIIRSKETIQNAVVTGCKQNKASKINGDNWNNIRCEDSTGIKSGNI